MAHKKYTQFIFDDLEDPERRENIKKYGGYGDLGLIYDLFIEITRIRKEKRLSQLQLSKKAGITQPALARLEAGRGNPTALQLVKIIYALDCKLKIEPRN